MARFALIIVISIYASNSLASWKLLTYNYPPQVEVSPGNLPIGRTVEIVSTLFHKAKVSYYYEQVPLRRALYETTNQNDTCTFPVDRTQELEAFYRWIGPISVNRYALFKHSSSHISLITIDDAKAYNVATFAGSGISEYLKRDGFKVFETKRIEHGLHMLEHGRVDLWVTDTYSAQTLSAEHDQIRLKRALSFFTSVNYLACNLNMTDEVYRTLRESLNHLYLSGDAQKLLGIESFSK